MTLVSKHESSLCTFQVPLLVLAKSLPSPGYLCRLTLLLQVGLSLQCLAALKSTFLIALQQFTLIMGSLLLLTGRILTEVLITYAHSQSYGLQVCFTLPGNPKRW